MLLSASEIISESINLYKKNFKTLVSYAGLVAFAAILMSFISEYAFPVLFTTQQPVWLLSLAIIALVIVTALLNIWFMIALINVIAQLFTKQKVTTLKLMLKGASKHIVPAFLASILVGLMTVAGFIFFIIPGILFVVWFTFTTQGIALHGKKPIDAIKSSRKLVLGRWWAVLWRLLAPGVVFIIMIWAAQFVVGILLSLLTSLIGTSTLLNIIITILLTVTAVLFVPLTTSAQTILYLNLVAEPLKPKKAQTIE